MFLMTHSGLYFWWAFFFESFIFLIFFYLARVRDTDDTEVEVDLVHPDTTDVTGQDLGLDHLEEGVDRTAIIDWGIEIFFLFL